MRRYYSSRTKPPSLTVTELYGKIRSLYLLLRDKNFFREKAGVTAIRLPDQIKHEAALALTFQPFPITEWEKDDVTEDRIFDTLEFLYDHVSDPEGFIPLADRDWTYEDIASCNTTAGKEEFRTLANAFLADYRSGYELTEDGVILALGSSGLKEILDAEIIPYDEVNVDGKVRNAIRKWRNRHLSLAEKKEAIRELADVFEWFKKTGKLGLDKKDESALFDIANNFAIRHHDPKQKSNYNRTIWYSWMFHFYLATYHAVVRLVIKAEKKPAGPIDSPTVRTHP